MIRCKECAHWSPKEDPDEPEMRDCLLLQGTPTLSVRRALAVVWVSEWGGLSTAAEFGCVLGVAPALPPGDDAPAAKPTK